MNSDYKNTQKTCINLIGFCSTEFVLRGSWPCWLTTILQGVTVIVWQTLEWNVGTCWDMLEPLSLKPPDCNLNSFKHAGRQIHSDFVANLELAADHPVTSQVGSHVMFLEVRFARPFARVVLAEWIKVESLYKIGHAIALLKHG